MPGGDFLDANVILYAFDEDLAKRSIAVGILERAEPQNTSISFQVVQEVLNVLTCGADVPRT